MIRRKGRPELGELAVGQDVIVYLSSNDSRRKTRDQTRVPARVTKAARVWIELERVGDGYPKTWRMRRDVQGEGTQYPGSNAHFATKEQYEWDETAAWAHGILREQGITVEHRSPWKNREIELADLIAAHLQAGPP